MRLTSILCATDLSDGADLALREAERLARHFGAALAVLHVVPRGAGAPMSAAGVEDAALRTERLGAEIGDALTERIAELTGREPGAYRLLVEEGAVDDVIAASAAELGADLVVIGASGAAGALTRLLGTTAERVVKSARASVLVVRPSPASGLVVAASDFSDGAERAADLAEALAVRGRLVLLHVLAPFPGLVGSVLTVPGGTAAVATPVGGGPDPTSLPGSAAFEQTRSALRRRLDERLVRAGLTGTSLVVHGDPTEEIVAAAGREQAELVVLGGTERSGIDRLLLGSVAKRIARDAPCSVLVVRSADEA